MEFLRRNRILLASASLLVCSLLLVSVSVRAGHRDPVGRLLLDALAPFQVVFSWIGRGTGRLWSGYVDVVDARHEADELRARVAVLEGQLARLSEMERENQRLGALLHFREQLPATAYGARVIARDPGPLSTTMTIDRGSRDGVVHGMAVVAPEGVVGRVVEVSYTVSRVALLTDHNSGIDAIVDRTRGARRAAGRERRQLLHELPEPRRRREGRRPRPHLRARQRVSQGHVHRRGRRRRSETSRFAAIGDRHAERRPRSRRGGDARRPDGAAGGGAAGIMRSAAAIALVAGFGVLLQTTLIHALPTRFQIAPDILLAVCVFLGLHRHTVGGVIGAFLLGYAQDAVGGGAVGLNAFGMVVVYLLVYLTCRRLWVDNVLSKVVLVFLASWVKTVAVLTVAVVFGDHR